jgi:hypothetical protein
MLHKFYVVVDHPDYKQEILDEIDSTVDSMPGSEHNSVAMLTQDQADLLISDLRIRDVHRDPYELGVIKTHCGQRSGTYDKQSASTLATHKNWALIRSTATSNIFGTASTINGTFPYNLDGTGVDIVIIDSGVEPNHPEFAVNADGTGGSRVVDHDWTQYGYITSAPTGGFMGDYDGHGSNCASIAAGNTCGWAPGARIYSLRSVGAGGTDITDGRQLGLLDDFQVWQSLRAFHNAKTADPVTGYKRPTIVNCSFGFVSNFSTVTAINYRGTSYSVSTTTAAYGTIGIPQGGTGQHGYRYTALETEIASCISAGIVVVAAAGNDRHKIDVPSGSDYGNYWTDHLGTIRYYHRGCTPSGTPDIITVGCIASLTTANINPEHKRAFSCTGPRVDIWAPGDYIMGAYANQSYATAAVADTRSIGTYTYYLNKISGTSQACPQVVGVLACLLQTRPWMTPQQVRAWTTATASTWLVNEAYYGGSGYTNFGSLQGAAALALWQPFILSDPLVIRG